MGIVNVTPDSFSDGGSWADHDAAIAHAFDLVAAGADIIDVGGESTRPGASRPSADEELRRVLPVVTALARAGVTVSLDTMRAEVAHAGIRAGACIINDVSGGLADPEMFRTVAPGEADYVVMHWRGQAAVMNQMTQYADVVTESRDETLHQLARAEAAGIEKDRLILDPGIGFSKTAAQNWEILRRLDVWEDAGHRLLIGVSRKRFLGELLATGGMPRPVTERDDASAAITAVMAARRVWAVRTHTARPHRDAIAVMEALRDRPAMPAGSRG